MAREPSEARHCEGCGELLKHPRGRWCRKPECDLLRRAAEAQQRERWRQTQRVKDRRCKACDGPLEPRVRSSYCKRPECIVAREERRRERQRVNERNRRARTPRTGTHATGRYAAELDEIKDRAMRVEDPGRKRIARAAFRTAHAEGREPTRDALLVLAAECTAWAEVLRAVPGGPWEPGG